METPSYVALSRQTALARQMDTVANNLANVATPGFKKVAGDLGNFATGGLDALIAVETR